MRSVSELETQESDILKCWVGTMERIWEKGRNKTFRKTPWGDLITLSRWKGIIRFENSDIGLVWELFF